MHISGVEECHPVIHSMMWEASSVAVRSAEGCGVEGSRVQCLKTVFFNLFPFFFPFCVTLVNMLLLYDTVLEDFSCGFFAAHWPAAAHRLKSHSHKNNLHIWLVFRLVSEAPAASQMTECFRH